MKLEQDVPVKLEQDVPMKLEQGVPSDFCIGVPGAHVLSPTLSVFFRVASCFQWLSAPTLCCNLGGDAIVDLKTSSLRHFKQASNVM